MNVKRSMRKSNLIKVIAEYMVDNDIFKEEVLKKTTNRIIQIVDADEIRKGKDYGLN